MIEFFLKKKKKRLHRNLYWEDSSKPTANSLKKKMATTFQNPGFFCSVGLKHQDWSWDKSDNVICYFNGWDPRVHNS